LLLLAKRGPPPGPARHLARRSRVSGRRRRQYRVAHQSFRVWPHHHDCTASCVGSTPVRAQRSRPLASVAGFLQLRAAARCQQPLNVPLSARAPCPHEAAHGVRTSTQRKDTS
jgi:hypothetical protein